MEMSLEEVFEFIRNGASIKQFNSSGVPITRIETIATGNIDLNKVGYADIFDSKYESYYLKDGDILMSHINSLKHLGKVAIVESLEENVIHGMNLLCLRPKKMVCPKFLLNYFRTQQFNAEILRISKKSVNQASFNITDLKKIKINLPNLEIQNKIANTLDLASELIEKRKEQIAEMDKLVQSMFEEVLSKEKCSTVNFDELIVSSKNGLSRRAQDEDGDVVLKIPNIQPNSLDLRKLNKIRLTEQERDKYSLSLEDLLIVRVNGNPNYVGRNAVFLEDDSYYFNDHIIRVRVKGINVKYLSYYLNSRYGKSQIAKNIKTSAGQYTISRPGLDKVKIIMVSKHTQERFVSFCSEILLQKKVMEESLHEMENNFNALIQKAFCGELFPEE